MTPRQKTLRRNDFWACALLVVAGVAAQLAMWRASQRDEYLWAVPLLLFVTGASAWQRGRQLGAFLRIALQGAKLLACLGLLAYFVTSGVVALPQHTVGHGAARPSATAALGAILLVVQLVQSATATTRRDLSLGAPAICAMLAQAGVAAQDAAPAPAFVVALLAMVGGVALVFRGELLDESPVVSALSRSFRVPSTVLQVVAVAALVFVLAPNSTQLHARPVSHAKQPTSPARAAGGDGGAPALDPHSQAIADPAAGTLDLRVRGALSNAPVFVVAADAPAYWQGAVFDRYDGASWTTSGSSTGQPWSVDTRTTPPTQTAPADAEPSGGGLQTRTDSVQIVTPQAQHVVFAPGRAVSYVGAGSVSSDGDGAPRLDVGAGGPPSGRDYAVVSTQPNLAAPAAQPADVRDPRWLQLPADLPTRVRALSHQLIGAGSSRADAVRAVDDYLRRVATYDLDAPVPPAGEDAVDSFLFVTHQGFCEQFASAAVVLLRAAGIPSRLVTGYSQGDLTSDPGRRVMRGQDAHAWIQVWYPGIGWVDSDPTANAAPGTGEAPAGAASVSPAQSSPGAQTSSGEQRSSGAGAETAAASPSASATPSATPQPAPAARASSDQSGLSHVVAAAPGGRIGLAAILVVALLAGRLAVMLGRRRAGRRQGAARAVVTLGDGPLLRAYQRLDDAMAQAGMGRAPGETARELRSRLTRLAQLADASVPSSAIATAIDLLERECYGIEPPNDRQNSFAVDVFGQLQSSVGSLENEDARAGVR